MGNAVPKATSRRKSLYWLAFPEDEGHNGRKRKQAAGWQHEQDIESSHLHFLSKAGVGVGEEEGDSESGRGFNLKTLPQGCIFLQQGGTT